VNETLELETETIKIRPRTASQQTIKYSLISVAVVAK